MVQESPEQSPSPWGQMTLLAPVTATDVPRIVDLMTPRAGKKKKTSLSLNYLIRYVRFYKNN